MQNKNLQLYYSVEKKILIIKIFHTTHINKGEKMKKLIVLLMAAMFGFTLAASEAAVKQTIIDLNDSMAALDVKKGLSMTRPEYTEKTSSGRVITYQDALTYAAQIETIKYLCSDKSTLMDFAVAAAAAKNIKLTEEQKAQIKAAENTPEGKKALQEMRAKVSTLVSTRIAAIKAARNSLKFISVKISNNTAVATYELNNVETNLPEITTATLVKVNGKWYFSKSETVAKK